MHLTDLLFCKQVTDCPVKGNPSFLDPGLVHEQSITAFRDSNSYRKGEGDLPKHHMFISSRWKIFTRILWTAGDNRYLQTLDRVFVLI